jgi:hypothetical protein
MGHCESGSPRLQLEQPEEVDGGFVMAQQSGAQVVGNIGMYYAAYQPALRALLLRKIFLRD